jgi:anionic cell wall polymer biosynthesis LytR-Cps2A-Psr (LCP) family protein
MQKINNFESFNSFLNFVNALEDTFTIDKNISTIEASSLLWDFRDINFDNVKKLTVPTYNYRTDNGAEVLILDENFYNFIQSNDLLD